MNHNEKVKLLDCTIRDGGYVNDWHFNNKLVREAYRALSKSGIDYVEIGFRGTEQHFDRKKYGNWRFSEDDLIREVTDGIDGAKIALMADFGKIHVDDFGSAHDTPIDMVRIAVNKDRTGQAIELLEKIKDKGYKVSLNAMGITNYTAREISELAAMLGDSDIDYVYIADSYGSLFPDQMKQILEPLLGLPDTKVGVHLHNSLQMAFANAIEAIKCGVHIIDSSMYGMGRGSGNLPTEIMLAYFQKSMPNKYNVIPVLNFIDLFLSHVYKENPWGYCLPYMLSGIFECHPYYAKELVDRRRYTIEDIWKVMDVVNKFNKTGYDKGLFDDILRNGLVTEKAECAPCSTGISTKPKKHSKAGEITYKNRHEGRTFLVLANGPNLKRYKDKIDAFINKHDPIILGANYLGGLFTPHYHAFTSKKRFIKYMDNVAPCSSLLISQHFPDDLTMEYTDRHHETLHYRDTLDDFDIDEHGCILSNCRTVSVLLLGVAIVMGAGRLFTAGMDGYISTGNNGQFLFYKEEDEVEEKELIIERHKLCQKYIAQIDSYFKELKGEDIHIITPTSYNAFYKGIDNYI